MVERLSDETVRRFEAWRDQVTAPIKPTTQEFLNLLSGIWTASPAAKVEIEQDKGTFYVRGDLVLLSAYLDGMIAQDQWPILVIHFVPARAAPYISSLLGPTPSGK